VFVLLAQPLMLGLVIYGARKIVTSLAESGYFMREIHGSRVYEVKFGSVHSSKCDVNILAVHFKSFSLTSALQRSNKGKQK
jgi:hypothetical protein